MSKYLMYIVLSLLFTSPAQAKLIDVIEVAKTHRHHSTKIAWHNTQKQAPNTFKQHTKNQAALEIQIALALYRTRDDYRAITALRRFQVLDPSANAQFLSSLMIAQIYHRNKKHPLATVNFERAMPNAPNTIDKSWAFLLAIQQMCLPLSYYVACQNRLNALLQVEQLSSQQRQLIDYQKFYIDLVLRSPYITKQRANLFSDPLLKKHAFGLIQQDRAFKQLDLQRPWLAASLSAVLPGAGQVYNGRHLDGAIALSINALLGASTYYAFAKADSIPLGTLSALLLSGFYIGNIVNAYTDAKRLNAKTYLAFFEKLKSSHWPRVHFAIQENQVDFGYTFDWPGQKAPKKSTPSTQKKQKDNML